MRFLPEDEAEKTMSLFEGVSENKRISKSVLKYWVVRTGDMLYAYLVPFFFFLFIV